MPLFLAKKPEQPQQPARDSLREHLRALNAVIADRVTLAERRFAMDSDIQAAATAADEVQRLSESIDQQTAAARYANEPPPDLSGPIAELNAAKLRCEKLERTSRAAALARTRVDADLARFTARLDAIRHEQPRLLHAALVESIEGQRAEFEQARSALLAVQHRIFSAALAADKVSIANHFGVFCGSARYGDTLIAQPAVFEPTFQDPYEAGRALEAGHEAKREAARQLDKDSDALVHQLLTGATG